MRIDKSLHPRPQFCRDEWMSLDGIWTCHIPRRPMCYRRRRPDSEIVLSKGFEDEIRVPFAPGTPASGLPVKEIVDTIYYHRKLSSPEQWAGRRLLLHFGAVFYHAEVFIDGQPVGFHDGGSSSFCLDVTEPLGDCREHDLVVKATADLQDGSIPSGKQSSYVSSYGCYYQRTTGIWQTVWLEPVAQQYVSSVRTLPDIDRRLLTFDVAANLPQEVDRVEAVVLADGKQVASGTALPGVPVEVAMPADMQLWSPDHPFLYDVEISLYARGRVVDRVKSYAAMRKYSTRRDANGVMRLQLNNSDLFQFGPLDQGWWPDGLYTAPTDEALAYDIRKTKDFGFNMIRKHVKVEPARWYTHCDRMGIIVWQDMPNGDRSPEWQSTQYFNGRDVTRTPESEANYRREWKEIMDYLYSYPCIGVWVPFNEAWGQFKTPEIAAWTKQYDPSRLVNPASGGNHYACGDMLDLHKYPAPELYLYDAQRPTVLGEYGGIGLAVEGHTWETKRNWGYVQFKTSEEATAEYVKYARQLLGLSKHGFSAAVYTQTTDVEVEINGLMTYDREVIKLDEKKVREINEEIVRSLGKE